jgi:hypothetical protein
VTGTNREFPRCLTFFIFVLLPLSWVQIFSSAPCSQTPRVGILPLMCDSKFHTHTEQWIRLVLCTYVIISTFYYATNENRTSSVNGRNLPPIWCALNLLLNRNCYFGSFQGFISWTLLLRNMITIEQLICTRHIPPPLKIPSITQGSVWFSVVCMYVSALACSFRWDPSSRYIRTLLFSC